MGWGYALGATVTAVAHQTGMSFLCCYMGIICQVPVKQPRRLLEFLSQRKQRCINYTVSNLMFYHSCCSLVLFFASITKSPYFPHKFFIIISKKIVIIK